MNTPAPRTDTRPEGLTDTLADTTADTRVPAPAAHDGDTAIPPTSAFARRSSRQPAARDAIGTLLVEGGHLTPSQMEQVLAEQKVRRRRFGELVVRLGFAPQKAVDGALARQFGYPVARDASGTLLPPGLVTALNPSMPFAESIRALRSQLMLRWFDGSPGRTALAVASVDQGDGKSYVSANLAVAFSQLGESTLLIDADMRNPSQHRLFGLKNRMGLSGLLGGRAGLSEIRKLRSLPRLSILPAGPLPPNPQELLGRDVFRHLLDELSSHFNVILVDTPSAQLASDFHVVARRTGAALIVARRDHTRARDVSGLSATLIASGVQVLGSTLNEY